MTLFSAPVTTRRRPANVAFSASRTQDSLLCIAASAIALSFMPAASANSVRVAPGHTHVTDSLPPPSSNAIASLKSRT